jgi:uncharacterized delta-60 repeat protein
MKPRYLHEALRALLVLLVLSSFRAWSADLTLGEALNAPELTWATSETAPWIVQTQALPHDGIAMGQSGVINAGENSWVETTVEGPGMISFWWLLSGLQDDSLEFTISGVRAAFLFNSGGWEQKQFFIDDGVQTLRWNIQAGSNAGGTAFLDEVAYTKPELAQPQITAQPVDQTILMGQTATFSVDATGFPPPAFQWLFNGNPINGATANSLELTNSVLQQAGQYSVIASNRVGKATSNPATLVVNTIAPSFTTQPASQKIFEGESVSFSAAVDAVPEATLRWFFGETPLDITGPVLSLTNATVAQAGAYHVTAENVAGNASSSDAVLTVLRPDEYPRGAGQLDSTFYPGFGVTGNITVSLLQADGKMLIAGGLSSVDGIPRSGLARLNPNGSVDLGFTAALAKQTEITALAIQPDGKILIAAGGAGAMDFGSGQKRIGFTRLNPDGTLDKRFDQSDQAGTGTSGVLALLLQPDGKILISGAFNTVNGQQVSRLARLTSDGLLDTTLKVGTAGTLAISLLALQPDGKIIVGGSFTTLNGLPAPGVARLNSDGSTDTTFAPKSFGMIQGMAFQPDGKVLVAGFLVTPAETHPANRIVRFNPDGQVDATFTFQTAIGLLEGLIPLVIQEDGKILTGVPWPQGARTRALMRLGQNFAEDMVFDKGSGPSGRVRTINLLPDGRIFVAGDFLTVDGVNRFRMARLQGDSPAAVAPKITQEPVDQTLPVGAHASLSVLATGFPIPQYQWYFNGAIMPQATNAVLEIENIQAQNAGKYQVRVSNNLGEVVSREATITVIAGLSGDFFPNFNFPVNLPSIFALSATVDGKLIIGGAFTLNGVVTLRGVARLNPDGSMDDSFIGGPNPPAVGAGPNPPVVMAVKAQADGRVLIGGGFTKVDGVTRNHIARLNADRSLDPTFGDTIGANDAVTQIVAQPDGAILIVGPFTKVGNMPRNHLARLNLDGTLDQTFAPGNTGIVNAIALQKDGQIVIAGAFPKLIGVGTIPIARLNADGTRDEAFASTLNVAGGGISKLALDSIGRVLIAGDFRSINAIPMPGFARLLSTGEFDPSFEPPVTASPVSPLSSIYVDESDKIIVAGQFSAKFQVCKGSGWRDSLRMERWI